MKTSITLVLLLALLRLSISACTYWGPCQKFVITNRHTGKPVFNASVTVFKDNQVFRNLKTDSQGIGYMYCYGGKFRLVVKHESYIGFDEQVDLSSERDSYITLELSARKYPRISIVEKERERYFFRTTLSSVMIPQTVQATHSSDDLSTFSCHFKHQTRKSAKDESNNEKVFNELLVYPNPLSAGNPLYIESKFDGKKIIVVYDMLGNEVWRDEMIYHYNLQQWLKPGFYVIKVIDAKNDDVAVQKLKIE